MQDAQKTAPVWALPSALIHAVFRWLYWRMIDKPGADEWHSWFAWHPVKLDDGSRVWLRHVWRRRDMDWLDAHYRASRP